MKPLKEKEQLFMVDPFSFLLIIAKQESESQYDETGNDHVIQSFKVFDLKH